jgi:hypothetical protein
MRPDNKLMLTKIRACKSPLPVLSPNGIFEHPTSKCALLHPDSWSGIPIGVRGDAYCAPRPLCRGSSRTSSVRGALFLLVSIRSEFRMRAFWSPVCGARWTLYESCNRTRALCRGSSRTSSVRGAFFPRRFPSRSLGIRPANARPIFASDPTCHFLTSRGNWV